MRLTIENIIFELQRAGGISAYWSELIRRFRANDSLEIQVYGDACDNVFKKELVNLEEIRESTWVPMRVRRYLPFLRQVESNQIFHSSYYRFSIQKDVINITTVHDFTYEHFGHGLRKIIHSFQKRMAISRASGVICVSENTKRDLIKFYPKIDLNCVKVIYNGVSDEFKPIKSTIELSIKFSELNNRKVLLFIGDRSSYKNFQVLLDIMLMDDSFALVVVGGKPFSKNELSYISQMRDRIFHYVGVTANDLNFLYNKAFCLVYPSRYEGFGIPLVEAMRAGCPVIAHNSSSIPEVVGNAALLFDEVSPQSILMLINKLDDKKFKNKLVEMGLKRANEFSWDRCAEETIAFYKEIYERTLG